jgi:hypothetical protein
MPEFTKVVKFIPGWDTSSQGQGRGSVHDMEISFTLTGRYGVVVADICTGWYPVSAVNKLTFEHNLQQPRYSCVTTHSTYDSTGDGAYTHLCDYLGGKSCYGRVIPCYLKDSGYIERFLVEGESAIWEALEKLYAHLQRGETLPNDHFANSFDPTAEGRCLNTPNLPTKATRLSK